MEESQDIMKLMASKATELIETNDVNAQHNAENDAAVEEDGLEDIVEEEEELGAADLRESNVEQEVEEQEEQDDNMYVKFYDDIDTFCIVRMCDNSCATNRTIDRTVCAAIATTIGGTFNRPVNRTINRTIRAAITARIRRSIS